MNVFVFLVGVFVVSWVAFWLLMVSWALLTGQPVPPLVWFERHDD